MAKPILWGYAKKSKVMPQQLIETASTPNSTYVWGHFWVDYGLAFSPVFHDQSVGDPRDLNSRLRILIISSPAISWYPQLLLLKNRRIESMEKQAMDVKIGQLLALYDLIHGKYLSAEWEIELASSRIRRHGYDMTLDGSFKQRARPQKSIILEAFEFEFILASSLASAIFPDASIRDGDVLIRNPIAASGYRAR
ncbi:predicted protein [Histoplasma capsulatum var. duboisii H88]|uniref:Predicted protein n=1 Tax=Ajellomyces capsulatus (strain H88) TaxID=544711 RepID=F0URZ2_AJEC8|nr:predicted protein [Histoplasma capsulatum var. duboisii H88]